jgi:serine/threonine-protein kinase
MGVILYECASGKRPFEADTLPHLALLIHEGKPQPLEELRPDLPPAFCELVRRAMASDRKQRFATARDLAAALAQFGGVSLDATMEGPAPVMVRTGSASAHSADLGPTMPGGQAISVAQEAKPKKSSKAGIFIAAAAVVVIGGGLAARSLMHSAAPEAPSAVAATTAPLAAPVPTPVATPEAPPVTTAPVASASAAPSATPAAPVAKNHLPAAPPAAHTPPPPAGTPPPAAPPTKASTRVDQKGLANDNPFK